MQIDITTNDRKTTRYCVRNDRDGAVDCETPRGVRNYVETLLKCAKEEYADISGLELLPADQGIDKGLLGCRIAFHNLPILLRKELREHLFPKITVNYNSKRVVMHDEGIIGEDIVELYYQLRGYRVDTSAIDNSFAGDTL